MGGYEVGTIAHHEAIKVKRFDHFTKPIDRERNFNRQVKRELEHINPTLMTLEKDWLADLFTNEDFWATYDDIVNFHQDRWIKSVDYLCFYKVKPKTLIVDSYWLYNTWGVEGKEYQQMPPNEDCHRVFRWSEDCQNISWLGKLHEKTERIVSLLYPMFYGTKNTIQ
jgi:hypothetical protein